MVRTDDPGALNDFLHRFLDDRERGAVQGVDAYQALFPGSDGPIAAEYAALTGAAATADTGVQEGLTQIGPYRLLGKLGHGAFGLVYRAEDTRLHRTVALKVLARAGLETEREREQFEREAAIASRLDHPGICTVYEIARHGLWTCIAMRHIPGETLAARLARATTEPLPVTNAIALLEKVARALHAAHSAGVVHRDVKAGNIMVTPDGEPVVVDFGLARDTLTATHSFSTVGDRSGSPSYMAPEQVAAGLGPVDARTDVWALGVTLYECLAGARPFEAPTQAALFDAILRREPVPLRSRATRVSRDLEVVVTMALAKEPAARYQTAQAFADDLARVQRGEPVQARPIGRLGKVARWARRNPAVASLLAAVLLVLTVGVVVAGTLWMQAEYNLRDWERLADGRRFVQLQRAADAELLPVGPDKVAGIEAWLAASRDLLSRRGEHEAALAALRARSKPWSAATEKMEQQKDAWLQSEIVKVDGRLQFLRDRIAELDTDPPPGPAQVPVVRAELAGYIEQATLRRQLMATAVERRLCYEFDDLRDQLQHDEITELVLGLRWLGGEPGQRTTTIEAMELRLQNARTLARRTVDDHAAAWRGAVARVLGNPAYRGLVLVPQVGLIPIGPDPRSGLEEFVAPETGTVPERATDGSLVVTPPMAIVFVLLPPGRFPMGAQASDPAAAGYDPMAGIDEAPVRQIDVEPFLLGKYEVTQAQWERMGGENLSMFNRGQRERGGKLVVDYHHPVESVSYQDADLMLRRMGWWLPSEARWEYACRAGSTSPWCCDRSEIPQCANVADRAFHRNDENDQPFVDADDGRGLHAPVGSYRANAFGLHDMLGNVAEWCYEQFVQYDPKKTTASSVLHILGKNEFVLRGGHYGSPERAVRCAVRNRAEGTTRSCYNGLRPMRVLTRG